MDVETYKKYSKLFNIIYITIVLVIIYLSYGSKTPGTYVAIILAFIYSMITKIHESKIKLKYSDKEKRVPILFTRFIHYSMIISCITIFGLLLGGDLLNSKVCVDLSVSFIIIFCMSLSISCVYKDIAYVNSISSYTSKAWYINRLNSSD